MIHNKKSITLGKELKTMSKTLKLCRILCITPLCGSVYSYVTPQLSEIPEFTYHSIKTNIGIKTDITHHYTELKKEHTQILNMCEDFFYNGVYNAGEPNINEILQKFNEEFHNSSKMNDFFENQNAFHHTTSTELFKTLIMTGILAQSSGLNEVMNIEDEKFSIWHDFGKDLFNYIYENPLQNLRFIFDKFKLIDIAKLINQEKYIDIINYILCKNNTFSNIHIPIYSLKKIHDDKKEILTSKKMKEFIKNEILKSGKFLWAIGKNQDESIEEDEIYSKTKYALSIPGKIEEIYEFCNYIDMCIDAIELQSTILISTNFAETGDAQMICHKDGSDYEYGYKWNVPPIPGIPHIIANKLPENFEFSNENLNWITFSCAIRFLTQNPEASEETAAKAGIFLAKSFFSQPIQNDPFKNGYTKIFTDKKTESEVEKDCIKLLKLSCAKDLSQIGRFPTQLKRLSFLVSMSKNSEKRLGQTSSIEKVYIPQKQKPDSLEQEQTTTEIIEDTDPNTGTKEIKEAVISRQHKYPVELKYIQRFNNPSDGNCWVYATINQSAIDLRKKAFSILPENLISKKLQNINNLFASQDVETSTHESIWFYNNPQEAKYSDKNLIGLALATSSCMNTQILHEHLLLIPNQTPLEKWENYFSSIPSIPYSLEKYSREIKTCYFVDQGGHFQAMIERGDIINLAACFRIIGL